MFQVPLKGLVPVSVDGSSLAGFLASNQLQAVEEEEAADPVAALGGSIEPAGCEGAQSSYAGPSCSK